MNNRHYNINNCKLIERFSWVKKCVFKIAKGSPIETDDKKCYKVKLVRKNLLGEIEQEVTFNEHYAAHYKNIQYLGEHDPSDDYTNQIFCYSLENETWSVSNMVRNVAYNPIVTGII